MVEKCNIIFSKFHYFKFIGRILLFRKFSSMKKMIKMNNSLGIMKNCLALDFYFLGNKYHFNLIKMLTRNKKKYFKYFFLRNNVNR